MRVLNWLVAGVGLLFSVSAMAEVDLASFLRQDRFESIKISPNGDYYALTAPLADRTVLVVMRRADKVLTAKVQGAAGTEIHNYWWVNNERLVVSMADRWGAVEQPYPTGELHAVNADGSKDKRLISRDGSDDEVNSVTFGGAWQYVTMIDDLPQNDQHILIAVQPYEASPQTRVERLDVYTGGRMVVATAPVRRGRFAIDSAGEARFVTGAGDDNRDKLFYREHAQADWELLLDEAETGTKIRPVGFSVDDRTVYLWAERKAGPDAVMAYDVDTRQQTELARDILVDPYRIVFDSAGVAPVGVSFQSGPLSYQFFSDASPEAKLHKILQSAFAGQSISVTSSTRDGALHIVKVTSDRNPGDFYLFDSKTNGASLIFSRSEWLNPKQMAGASAVSLKARDGMPLHGYLTTPVASNGKLMPLIVLPHGGPFGIFDEWTFDAENQILAAAGYAVLQINYRGSGNYGLAFTQAGAGEWGGKMQDDLTDATRWAIDEGIADPKRICLYGASYGAYAALMGVAKEPELYRCAVGYVGVYDLPRRYDDLSDSAKWLGTWAKEWLGPRDALVSRSPTHLAEKIKVPVFLAAGGKDFIAPVEHTEQMEAALKAAKVPVESLYYRTEGHGFYLEENRLGYYRKLLDFLSRQLGGKKAK